MNFGKYLMEQRFALAAVFLLLSFDSTLAQQGNELANLRQACGGDFAAYCQGVQAGGGRIIGCLRQNMARLSPPCRQLVASVGGGQPPGAPPPGGPPPGGPPHAGPPPAAVAAKPVHAAPAGPPPAAGGPAAPPPPTEEQLAAIHKACEADYAKKCAGVAPGGQEAMACLLHNANEASPACQDALAVLPPPAPAAPAAHAPARPHPAAAAAGPPPPGPGGPPGPPPPGGPPPYPPAAMGPPPPGAVVVVPPPGPTPVQMAIRACDRDRERLCGLVVPGEGHVLSCLLQSIRAVSPVCRRALAMLPR